MQSLPLKECPDICHSIVNYVYHSGEDIVLGNAVKEGLFTNDPYVMRVRLKSILCTPIMSKGKISGILYMENNISEKRLYAGTAGSALKFFRSGRHIHRKREALRTGHDRRHDQVVCPSLFSASARSGNKTVAPSGQEIFTRDDGY